jgi:hypothetical protein
MLNEYEEKKESNEKEKNYTRKRILEWKKKL